MLKLQVTTRFKKDIKRMQKQGKPMHILKSVIDDLLEEKPLDAKYRDHALVGNYIGFRECHLMSDWLLVYSIDHITLILTAYRTGTHSDLFDE